MRDTTDFIVQDASILGFGPFYLQPNPKGKSRGVDRTLHDVASNKTLRTPLNEAYQPSSVTHPWSPPAHAHKQN